LLRHGCTAQKKLKDGNADRINKKKLAADFKMLNAETGREDVLYFLTVIGLSPGGSTHLHTNNTQKNTNKNRTTQITNNVEECRLCPVFASPTLAFVLQLKKNMEKPQSG
jgi:hypothetical protein